MSNKRKRTPSPTIEFVNGSGFISDESSFHGDDDVKSDLESVVNSKKPAESPYWRYQAQLPSTISFSLQVTASDDATTPSENASPTAVTKNYNPYPDRETSYQFNETAEAFTKRLPPSRTTFEDAGPWLWAANPHAPRERHAIRTDELIASGQKLLDAYRALKAKTEQDLAGKAKQTVTKKLTPSRVKLEADLRALAQRTHLLTGKWMLFPAEDAVDRTWNAVVEAVVAGELGPAAKVATRDGADGSDGGRLICVYTRDFGDAADVRRVVRRLRDVGLVRDDGAGGDVWYKCDYYTHLGIGSGNEYGLRASMCGSRDMLKT